MSNDKQHDAVRETLLGATIEDVIFDDHRKSDRTLRLVVRRRDGPSEVIVIGYNELGMWLEHEERP